MKIAHESADRLILTQRWLWVRAIGAALMAGALAFALVANAGQELACNEACVIVEWNLVGMKTTYVIAAADVRQIDVVSTRDGDEDTHCVVIVTAARSHEIDRCSAKREAYLDDLVRELRAFYAGERPSLARTRSDAGIVAFPVILLAVLGLMAVLLPPVARADFDRKRGSLTLRDGLVLLRRTQRVALTDIAGIAVEIGGANEHGPQHHLVLSLRSGQKLPISAPTSADLEAAQRAVERFLGSSASGYR